MMVFHFHIIHLLLFYHYYVLGIVYMCRSFRCLIIGRMVWLAAAAAAATATGTASLKGNFHKRIKWRKLHSLPAHLHISSYNGGGLYLSFSRSVRIFEFMRSKALLWLSVFIGFHFFLMIVFGINSQLFATLKCDIVVDYGGIQMHAHAAHIHTDRSRECKFQYIHIQYFCAGKAQATAAV